MGIEFLIEGGTDIERADGPELFSIKLGEWPLEQVKAEAERLFQLAQEAYVIHLFHPNQIDIARRSYA